MNSIQQHIKKYRMWRKKDGFTPVPIVLATGNTRRKCVSANQLVRGFTLIETLVAITILLVAIVGPIHTISQATALGARSRDELIASYLAQDAVEYLRYRIVTNGNEVVGRDLTDGLDNCMSPNKCYVNTKKDVTRLCDSGVCDSLEWSNAWNYYGYLADEGMSGAWGPTDFRREVTIVQNNNGPANSHLGNGTEFYIVSTVYWGKQYENHLQISENIVDWRIIFNP